MGSLMAGWDSPFQDPKRVTYQRNKSLTKEEIEAYWRSKKKKTEEDQLYKNNSPTTLFSDPFDHSTRQERYHHDVVGTKYWRSSSLPTANTVKKATFMDMEAGEQEKEASWENLNTDQGWWTRSNWAFLNEPPVFEGTTRGYSSQFHVANLEHAKANNSTASGP